ncbi:MAG TPA: thioredoxin domain-containing protein [Candidatus Deferrimicrobium sp.]|nr:thioredoxin domain-containing protein [Candidatus Deferrimicrobium sp.]
MKQVTSIAMITALATMVAGQNDATAGEKDLSMKETTESSPRQANHLAGENSPYLLSHAHNPVNWYPWGEEALAKAKAEDKPIFLSIGYAACHWCHVMERESFENEEIAAVLNRHFVSIKVDREQRPDLDEIYMAFTTALTGRGGWPMSVFLTPDLKPFFAGTYFPPQDQYGRPGFLRVITEIAAAYSRDRAAVAESALKIYDEVITRVTDAMPPALLTAEMVSRTARSLMQNFDDVHGGFGSAPKFPHVLELSLCLRHYKKTGDLSYLQAAEKTLRAMAHGGIYDHLAGGFARYSTDARWLVPHFEKMLYDNALLVPVYVEAYQITRDEFYRTVVGQTLDFLLNEMTDATGGFYSAIDADSEGEEGRYYVWTKHEIDSILGDDRSRPFTRYYNVTEQGNFEGRNILNIDATSDRFRAETDEADFDRLIEDCRQRLAAARAQRVRPLTDDKILTSWNGLALSAFCRGYQITGDQRYLNAAVRNAVVIETELFRDGRLTHAFRDGHHSEGEFLEDYAYLVHGLLDLYETDTSGNCRWLAFTLKLTDRVAALFADSSGRLYLRPDNQKDLIIRPFNESDGSLPAPGSIMIANWLKLNRLTGRTEYLEQAEKALRALSGKIERASWAMTAAVLALDYYVNDKVEIVVIGTGQQRVAMLDQLYRRFIPNRLIAISDDGHDPLPVFEGREVDEGEVRAYICRNSVCRLPAATVEEFKAQLDRL